MRRLGVYAAVGAAALAAATAFAADAGRSGVPAGARTLQSADRSQARFVRLAGGFNALTHVAAPRSENRLYLVEQPGRIVVLAGGRRRVFLDIRRLVSCCGEQGLFSVAFHPQYARNRRLYVNYTDRNGDTRVVEYRSNGRRALAGTARRLLFVNQPYANHNGGQLAFGPDGRLYVGMGDGGSGGDPENRAQNLRSRLGKLLRIDVNARPSRIETVAYGLRNPWRFAFDRANGDLYIGDVGQSRFEEVDYTPRRSPGLENYGWDVYEGNARYENKEPNGAGRLVFPIAVYRLTGGHCTVIGGFVYRGRRVPAQRGRYFYGDYCSGTIWSLRVQNGRAASQRREPFRIPGLTSFGESAAGELYAVSQGGALYRLAT